MIARLIGAMRNWLRPDGVVGSGNTRLIANADLTLSLIPDPDSEWTAVWDFAHTFDGYSHWGSAHACGVVANERRNTTLTDLRTCLFFEQRRYNHFGKNPDGEDAQYIRDVVRQIGQRVSAGQLD